MARNSIFLQLGIVITAAIGISQGQTAPPRPQFEVASIKPSGTPPHLVYVVAPPRVNIGFMSLKDLIQFAYGIQSYRVSGPDWMTATRFDLMAKMPEGSTKEQFPEMLQSLLADRFGLIVHHEPKEQGVYALLPGKDGPKLNDPAPDNRRIDDSFLKGRAILSKMQTVEGDGFWAVSSLDHRNVFDAPRITMPELAVQLSAYTDDPIVDMTDLQGYWHVRLDVPRKTIRAMAAVAARDAAGFSATASDPDGDVSIFASVQKLGLVLEQRKAPVDHIVVDHIEKLPTEN